MMKTSLEDEQKHTQKTGFSVKHYTKIEVEF